ncbi:MAG: hypothetical protein HY017_25730 [Betaproteobacteria bacterium]|nr:hypothetical protein [Betaproteobacteria bacterium]
MSRALVKGVVFPLVFLFAFAYLRPAFAIDPVLMFLFNVARDAIEARENAKPVAPALEPQIEWPETYPGTTVTPGLVKRLIDDCFDYLSASQRSELFRQLNTVLLDPKNALMRAPLIEHFAARAVSVRQARIYLAGLSTLDKEALALQFRDELGTLSEDDRARFIDAVRSGLLPVPPDLNRMFLAVLQPG